MAKEYGYKAHHFNAIADNINPLSDNSSVVKCTNVESHVKPGIFTLRPPYQCKYLTPIDSQERIDSPVSISFENFFEEKSDENGTEVTIQVQRAQIKAPKTISGITYTFNSPIIWMRPSFDGAIWTDKWEWLNETNITNLVTGPDGTYKNQFDFQGYFGDMTQWTVINVSRDSTLPIGILYSVQNGTNTTIFISNFINNWQSGDFIVLMKNYIPMKYLTEMYNVTQQEISFHIIPSKIRIGFGGKANRIALGIEYIKNTIQMSNYSFPNVAPRIIGQERLWATVNKMVVQPYSQFNEDQKDFGLNILTATGSWPAGTYYFRMTVMLDGTNEILVLEQSIAITINQKFNPIPWIRAGSISRRLTSVKVYFGQNNTNTNSFDYYLFKEYPITTTGEQWLLDQDGKLVFPQTNSLGVNIYTENSAAGSVNDSGVGSWLQRNDGSITPLYSYEEIVSTGDVGSHYLKMGVKSNTNIVDVNTGMLEMYLPISVLDTPIKAGENYKFSITYQRSAIGSGGNPNVMTIGWSSSVRNGGYLGMLGDYLTFSVTNSLQTVTFNLKAPDVIEDTETIFIAIAYGIGTVNIDPGYGLYITGLSIEEIQENYLDIDTQLGSLDIKTLGYTPTLNLVKDWGCALVRRGSVFVASAYIKESYTTLVFFSPISGDGNPQYDVLIAGQFLDADKDSFRGEKIIAIGQLLNNNILVLTEAGGTIIDPDSGETQEVNRGLGIVTKDTLRNYMGYLFWASIDDFVATDSSGNNAKAIDENSVRNFYKSCPDKTLLSACIDIYGSYHVCLGELSEVRELLFTPRGWYNQDREHNPVIMRNGYLNVVWFMDKLGNIFNQITDLKQIIGYGDSYGDANQES